MCNNSLFNKIFFFSISFLFISAITHVVYLAAASADVPCKSISEKVKIQTQQKEIMTRLQDVEERLLVRERR